MRFRFNAAGKGTRRATMQAGFTPNTPHMGTPLDVSLSRGFVGSENARAVFDATLPYPDMAMNERLSQTKRSAPQLQGMHLTKPPTGGFPAAQPHIVIGADMGGGAGGEPHSVRLPPLFTTPFVGNDRRTTVMPDGPLTGVDNGETVYREPASHATRDPRGAMTTAHAEKEARRARRRRNRHFDSILASAGVTPEAAAPQPQPQPQPAAASETASAPRAADAALYAAAVPSANPPAPSAACESMQWYSKHAKLFFWLMVAVGVVAFVFFIIILAKK